MFSSAVIMLVYFNTRGISGRRISIRLHHKEGTPSKLPLPLGIRALKYDGFT